MFLSLQWPYCVSVLLLTSGSKLALAQYKQADVNHKSAPAQYKHHYYLETSEVF